jgi:anaphase-promoting complex subunit 6
MEACLATTTAILHVNSLHPKALLLHVACLYHLRRENGLFVLAHALVDAQPASPLTWYAVGSYYLLKGQNQPARKYFSKAVTLDARLAEGWMGFGHSFREKGELDQAVSAYSTAKKLAPAAHEPLLYLGRHLGCWDPVAFYSCAWCME